MSRYLKIIILVVIFSFAWGTWWGFYSIEKNKPHSEKGPRVRVLAEKGYFSAKFVQAFHERFEMRLVVTEKDTPTELIRETLSNGSAYDLIEIPSFIARSFLLDNVFTELDRDEIPRLRDLSVDFRGMEYDSDDKFLMPLTWGLNGFVVNAARDTGSKENLQGILAPVVDKKWRASLLPSPVELYSLAIKMKPAAKQWLETGEETELKKELRDLKGIFKEFVLDPRQLLESGTLQAAQISSGQAANWLQSRSTYRYVLPEERASLWIRSLGISLGASDKRLVHRVLNQFLDPEIAEVLVKTNEQATTLTTVRDERLAPMQRAKFIRMVPLSRVELLISSDALEPLWTRMVAEEILAGKSP